MPEKSLRRLKLEASLADDPADTFMRYGLAMQCLREGETDYGRTQLLALIADHPDEMIAAYQQLGQSYMESSEIARATEVLIAGVAKAKAKGDSHAASEMEGFLQQIR